jgi:hypothetical protein
LFADLAGQGICIAMAMAWAMFNVKIVLAKRLHPPSELSFRLPKVQQPLQ